ncbi:MAG: isocitrate lyase/phosphoenolpyruvate mutase family protein [Bacteroidota bacterium]
MTFAQLHQQAAPLLLCNAWDVPSALAAQQAGFQAIGTSSGAVARMLGYPDGEAIPFATLRLVVERIASAIDIPLSVDLEGGYSRDPKQIIQHIQLLAEMGVQGVNVEDSVVDENGRHIQDAQAFAEIVQAVTDGLNHLQLDTFLNIRTDPFLLGMKDAQVESIRRGKLYAQAGAHGLFVPCVTQETDIQALVEAIPLPLNVMAMPELPAFSTLHQLGVKRISMGSFAQQTMLNTLNGLFNTLQQADAFTPIFT